MERYLLDTSAILTLRDNEEGADDVAAILDKSRKGRADAHCSFMSFMEVYYGVWRAEGKGSALQTYLEMKMLPLNRCEASESLLLLAGEIKATHSLSLADSWIAATAIEKQAILVHKDPEFEQLKGRISLQPLSPPP